MGRFLIFSGVIIYDDVSLFRCFLFTNTGQTEEEGEISREETTWSGELRRFGL